MKYICPFCNTKCDWDHIRWDHEEQWWKIGLQAPPESYLPRLNAIGMTITRVSQEEQIPSSSRV